MDFFPKIIVNQRNVVFISVYRVLQPLNEQTSNVLMPMRNKIKVSTEAVEDSKESVKTFSPNYFGVKHGLRQQGP